MSGQNKKHKTSNNITTTSRKSLKQKSKANTNSPARIRTTSRKKSTASGKKIAIGIATVALVIVAVVVCQGLFKKSYEEYDLKGLTAEEACKKARGAGWEVNGVIEIEGSGRTDCYNKSVIVTDYSYYRYNNSVSIYYGEKKTEEQQNTNQEQEQEQVKAEGSSSNSSDSSNNSSSSTSSWRQVMDGYEAWVNDYVDFMVKYKNSSNKTAMMSDYTRLLNEMTEWLRKIDSIKDDITTSDMVEYMQILNRINQKISQMN